MAAKWTGPCKANMKAGDVILPNGTKVSSLTEEPKARPARGKRERRHGGTYTPPTAPETAPSTTGTAPSATPPATK
jgi:hypothetical protein